jgi:hypothetical protein
MGASSSPAPTTAIVTADAAGTNSYPTRDRKLQLGTLAAEIGLTITVCQ